MWLHHQVIMKSKAVQDIWLVLVKFQTKKWQTWRKQKHLDKFENEGSLIP